MANGRTEILDQYGLHWIVYPGDPADEITKKLKLDYIVLPRNTILTGVMESVEKPVFSGITTELTPAIAEVVKRTTRLYDIYHHLTESTSGNLPQQAV